MHLYEQNKKYDDIEKMNEDIRFMLNHFNYVLYGYNYVHGLSSSMRFGKYVKTKLTIREICNQDLQYLIWLLNNIENFKITKEVADYMGLFNPSLRKNILENKIW